MVGKTVWRNLAGVLLPLAGMLVAAGCADSPARRTRTISEQLAQTPPAAPGSASAGQVPDPVLARVNGQPIRRSTVANVLLAGRGKTVLDDLITLEAVRQQAAARGIKATPDRIEAERRRILEDMVPGKPVAEQEALLEYLLQSRGLSAGEFALVVERQTLLRELVDPDVPVSEEQLAAEYEREHGRKVQVRQLAVTSLRKLEAAQRRLAAGEDFALLAADLSEDERTLRTGALLGPFSAADEQVPPAVRRAAFGLGGAGQVSGPVRYRDEDGIEWWGLLRLERETPPAGPEPAAVREKLAQAVQQREIRRRMLALQQSLRAAAKVDLVDAALGPQAR